MKGEPQRFITMMISVPDDASAERFRAMLNSYAAAEGLCVLPSGEAGLDFFLKRKGTTSVINCKSESTGAGIVFAEPDPMVKRVEEMADAYIARGMRAVAKSGGTS